MSEENKFYVYKHSFSNGRIYIGKGVNDRCYDFRNRSEFWKRNFCKYGDPTVDVVLDRLSEEQAFELEEFLIVECIDSGYELGERLINFTTGGEGTSGYSHTEDTKKIISETSKKRWSDPTYRDNAVAKLKQYNAKEEAKERKSKESKSRWEDPLYVELMKQVRINTWKNPDHKEKMSNRMKGANNPSARRANIYKYPSGELVAENVVSAEWARDNGYSRPKLQTTSKSDLSKPSTATNPHHHKNVYMRYIDEC